MSTIAAMPMTSRPRRPWYALDLPGVLVLCTFVLVLEGIACVAYYRRQVALIPEPGRVTPRDVIDAASDEQPLTELISLTRTESPR